MYLENYKTKIKNISNLQAILNCLKDLSNCENIDFFKDAFNYLLSTARLSGTYELILFNFTNNKIEKMIIDNNDIDNMYDATKIIQNEIEKTYEKTKHTHQITIKKNKFYWGRREAFKTF